VVTPLSDIVKRRSIRASTFDTRVPGEAREGFGSWTRMKSRACLSAGLTARRRTDLKASWSFLFNAAWVVLPVGFRKDPDGGPRWALRMRAIKCLKGVWWMPWR
jgi:hypothetical protein